MRLARCLQVLARMSRIVALCAAGVTSVTYAQGTIVGHVTAAGTNAPLGDARVIVVGSSVAATTGQDGRYVLNNVRAGTLTVQVLHVGHEPLKKSVDVQSGVTVSLDFQMAEAVVKLQDVVTTATGQQRRVELGNSIATLGDVAKRVEESPITNMGDLLVAKAPGVVVLPGAMTGQAPVIRIRGLNSLSLGNAPIIFVDGVRAFSSPLGAGVGGSSYSFLNSIDPDEVEDVEIVKGPSAATLYGTDAANGVILITTKKGRAGNTQWTWFGEGGLVDDRNTYPTSYALWGHAPGSAVPTRCQLATMSPTTCLADSLTSFNLMQDPSRTFVKTGHRNQYGMQATGGTDAVRFFVSGDIQNELGPVQMPGFAVNRLDTLHVKVRDEWLHPEASQQTNVRANLSAALSPNFDLSVSTGFANTANRLPQSDNNVLSSYSAGMQTFGFAHPGLEYTGIGSLGEDLHGYNRWTPAEIFQDLHTEGIQRITASTNMNWRPLTWMQNDGTVGIDLSDRDDFSLCRLNECPAQGTLRQGSVSDTHSNNRLFSAKVTSTSTWNARPWANLKTTLGSDYTNNESDAASGSGTQLTPGGETVGAAATKSGTNTQPTAAKTLGLYVQEQAGFRDRMFFTAAVRSDQNSAFGSNFQRVFYPKLQMSWLVSDESFFPKWNWLNQLRARSAYGASGVQPGATTALVTFSSNTTNVPLAAGGTSGVDTPGLRANQLGNADLKPETSAEFEGGFDARVINNRVNLDVTYYSKQTHDALISIPIAASSGASSLNNTVNVGSVKNAGIEAQLTATLADTRRFGWDVTLSASHNANKVVNLGVDPTTGGPRFIGTGQTRQRVGYPIGSQWFQPYTYSDANKDGIIQQGEVAVDSAFAYFGYSSPRDIISAQSGFDLFSHALRINVLVDNKGGFVLEDVSTEFICQQSPQPCYETQNSSAPLWRQARAVAENYGTVIGGQTFKTVQGYNMNGQYWKFRELSATYTLPNRIAQGLLRSQSGTFTLSARNLHTWTKYTGIDPESNQTTGDIQFDFIDAPPPTRILMRFNLHY